MCLDPGRFAFIVAVCRGAVKSACGTQNSGKWGLFRQVGPATRLRSLRGGGMFLRVATVVGVGLAGLVVGSMIDLRASGGQALAQYYPPPPAPYPPQSYPPQQPYPAGRQLPPPVQAEQDDD